MSSAASPPTAVAEAGNPTEPRQAASGLAVAMLGFAVAEPPVRAWLRRINLLH